MCPSLPLALWTIRHGPCPQIAYTPVGDPEIPPTKQLTVPYVLNSSTTLNEEGELSVAWNERVASRRR